MVKYVLEKRLGCKVKLTQVTEGPPYFQAMRDGKVDVALEDWDNSGTNSGASRTSRIGSVRIVGANGITGVIGWYIPRYLLQQYPSFTTWRGLKGKESVFRSPESGSQGMFLGGDPVVRAEGPRADQGARPEPEARRRRRRAGAGRPLEPAVQAEEARALLLVRPAVPERAVRPRSHQAAAALQGLSGRREAEPGKHACEYPSYVLDKLVSKKFATSGSPAVKFVRNWKWTSADQNYVANLIAGKKMKPEKAAEQWVKANAAKVNAWLK